MTSEKILRLKKDEFVVDNHGRPWTVWCPARQHPDRCPEAVVVRGAVSQMLNVRSSYGWHVRK